jgi:hypothetical protein
LYDVTSTYLEGRCCPLARFGHNRDGKAHKLQIVFGVLCARDGCPIAVEVFAGNTADPSTLKTQIDKLRQRFGLRRVVLVGDRGMITEAGSATNCNRPGSIGSQRCAPPPSRRWPGMTVHCSSRCSTSAIWPRSPAPIIPASA